MDISCIINEWMILFDKRPFSPSVVTNQSIQSSERKMSEGVNMNSETSKLPLLPIIYCRFYKRVPCEPPGTITDRSAAELLQSWTASDPQLKTASNFKILFRSFCHNRILFRISGGLMMLVLTDISWSSR